MLKRSWLSILGLLLLVVVIATGCSGGGGGTTPPQQTPHTLSGIAAAGAPIVGIVNVKGANGATASSNIDSTGHFSLDVTNLTANYILFAEGRVNGKTIRIYSAAVAEGNINITPITDLIVANALGAVPDATLMQNWNGTQVTATGLDSAKATVQTAIAPLLAATGATATDPLTGSFKADGTGLDQALDFLNVSYTGSTATITNLATGNTCTNDVSANSSTALPSGDATATQSMNDLAGINAFWGKIETLWATSVPTQAAINSQLAPYIAPDVLNDGADKTAMLNDLITNSADMIGLKIAATIKEPMDVTSTPYVKGYWIYTTDSDGYTDLQSMVFDGTNWLWYGSRRWLNIDTEAFALMTVPATGSPTFQSGLRFWLEDQLDYAYNQGVRSAIVTGPGLPANGLKMELAFPETILKIYQFVPPSDGSDYFMSDAVIATIPDNSEYTFRFYTADVAIVTLSDTPVHTFTQIFAKAPEQVANLSAANFPTITSPTAHNLSLVHIPGTLTVSWTKPANEWVNWVWLGWGDSSSWQGIGNNNLSKVTSTTLDMTTFSSMTPTAAAIWMESYDNYQRMFAVNWQF